MLIEAIAQGCLKQTQMYVQCRIDPVDKFCSVRFQHQICCKLIAPGLSRISILIGAYDSQPLLSSRYLWLVAIPRRPHHRHRAGKGIWPEVATHCVKDTREKVAICPITSYIDLEMSKSCIDVHHIDGGVHREILRLVTDVREDRPAIHDCTVLQPF